MNQETSSHSGSEEDFETSKKVFAGMLLAEDSPVSNEAAFKRERDRYFSLLEQRGQVQKRIELLQAEAKSVSEIEQLATEAKSRHQDEKKQLLEITTELGKTAFAGLQAGEIADDPRFKPRKDLESRIDALKRQKASLASENVSGVVRQASLKAQQLKLAGQIKVEELKLGSVNKELGTEILSANAEETVRCRDTEKVLERISQRRQRIFEAEEKHNESEVAYENAKTKAAKNLGVASVSNASTIKVELTQKETELRLIETQIEALHDEVAEKALGYDWLRDNPALMKPLERLAQLKERSTPRKLSVWPLATVVIAGHLFSNFGSEPLNLSAFGVLSLYLATGLGGLGLLAYYKPELVAAERRYKSLFLLFAYSIISVFCIFLFQGLADYALENWSAAPEWAKGRLILLDLPRMFLVAVGTAYRDTFAIMDGTGVPESFVTYFQSHMFSVGLCEELIKLSPALVAFAGFTEAWRSRTEEFNSQLVYLAMIGGLAFGLGEAVHYHFSMYAPMQAGWGIYATRFLSLVTIHAVWAGISGWILAHITGGWIRRAFTTIAQGWGPVGGCLLIAATVGVSDFLHTSHNLSNDTLWVLTWDVTSLALFAWLIRCSKVSQLIPEQAKRLWKRGLNSSDVVAVKSRWQNRALGNTDTSSPPRSIAKEIHEDDVANLVCVLA